MLSPEEGPLGESSQGNTGGECSVSLHVVGDVFSGCTYADGLAEVYVEGLCLCGRVDDNKP